MDVQPANEPEWTAEPVTFVVDGNTYRGRGSTDDKGPAVTAFFGALAARRAGVPLNIHFLWELEEEIGSPSFEGGTPRPSRMPTGSPSMHPAPSPAVAWPPSRTTSRP